MFQDKRRDIAHGTAIATVSLGHARHFQLCLITELQRYRTEEKTRKEQMDDNKAQGIKQKLPPVAELAGVIDVVLPHGSLFVIGPKTNALYEHCIPQSDEECGRRYGLTFRTIASRWLPDAEVVIRQPLKGETAWDVMHRPKETRKTSLTGQNGYAYRSRVFLEQYTPADPRRLAEADINAVRASMPSRPKLKGKPSRKDHSDAEPNEDGAVSDASCGDDDKRAVAPIVDTAPRKGTIVVAGSGKKTQSKEGNSTAKRQKRESKDEEEEEEEIVILKQTNSTAKKEKRESKPTTRTTQREKRKSKAEQKEEATAYL